MKKKSTKESDAKWMRRVNKLLVKKLDTMPFTCGRINSLVFGSKKFKIIGFGSYEALIIAIKEVPKNIGDKYGYLRKLANSDEFINECNKAIDKVEPGGVITGIADVISKLKKEM